MPKYYLGDDAPVTVEDGDSSVARTAITAVASIIIVILILWAIFFSGWQNKLAKPLEKKVDVNITVPANR